MNIRQAKEEIRHTVRAYLARKEDGTYKIPAVRQRPMLLMGPPGIGKTQIMEQIAREERVGLVAYTITHHTRQSAVGLPFIREEEFDGKPYSVTEYTMSEIIASVYRKIRDTGQREGILFIDEINCVSETLAPTMLQFLQCKTFGNQAVPEGWLIVAAGNPSEYNKSVRDFDMVTLDRVRYLDVEADFRVWEEYARAQHICGAVMSYLALRPKNFYRVEADVDGLQYVTARGWEDLGSLMEVYEEMGIPVDEPVVREFVRHDEVAEDAAAYFDLYRKYRDDYGIPDILAGKVKPAVYARIYAAAFDERLSVVNLLLDGLTQQFIGVDAEKAVTDGWYAFLKEYKSALPGFGPDCGATDGRAGISEADGAQIYRTLCERRREAFLAAKRGGTLSQREAACEKRLADRLKLYAPQAPGGRERADARPERAEKAAGRCFLTAKAGFDAQRKVLEEAGRKAEAALENAFDFVERAFEGGQEMVVFVTELTLRPEAALFLAKHPSERYLRYNEQFLTGTRKAELLAELNRE